MNTLKELIKDNLEQMGLVESLSLPNLALVLGTALFCGLVIYLVYKYFFRGAVYTENFGLLIVMITMTVAFIIVTISSNLVLSLGMVGALSIVRFRTAVKDPLDVGFLFLAIAAGLTAGARLFFIAVIGTIVICMVFILMNFWGKRVKTYLLIIQCKADGQAEVQEALQNVKKQLKTCTGDGSRVELTYTVKVKDESLLGDVLKLKSVENAMLVAYTGDAQY